MRELFGRRGWFVAAAFAVVGLAACSSYKLGGEIAVNGEKTAATACRAASAGDEEWAETTFASGHRVRLVRRDKVLKAGETSSSSSSKDIAFVLFAPRSDTPIALKCSYAGSQWRSFGSGISGSANIKCSAPSLTVVGEYSFGQCS